jgi:hypothetical protein
MKFGNSIFSEKNPLSNQSTTHKRSPEIFPTGAIFAQF